MDEHGDFAAAAQLPDHDACGIGSRIPEPLDQIDPNDCEPSQDQQRRWRPQMAPDRRSSRPGL
jgi:hypothetical protein